MVSLSRPPRGAFSGAARATTASAPPTTLTRRGATPWRCAVAGPANRHRAVGHAGVCSPCCLLYTSPSPRD
eukprot:12062806-Alexandrium_andersonii.AAC.1